MMRRLARPCLWSGIALIVILLARAVAYALRPGPAARLLEHQAGGPALPTLALVSLALGGAFAISICWLAALGVRERASLERQRLTAPVRPLRTGRAVALGAALSVGTSFTGGLLEAYLHWRAGMGWHGLHCVVGPVHRDLIPIETAFSLVAAALVVAGEHVVAWMRRTFALLRALPPRAPHFLCSLPAFVVEAPPTAWQRAVAAPRGPPACS